MTDALQPVTFYVPPTTAEPIEIEVKHSGLRMVLVSRESIGLLSGQWAVLGIYILLGPAEGDSSRYQAYVGEVGKRTLLQRIREHAREKAFWSRALLVASRSDEFDSAEIGWLEGRIFDVLNNAVAADVINSGKPGDNSMDRRDRAVLERYVQPIMAALRACGASPDTVDQKPLPKRNKATSYGASVSDLLAVGLLKAGTQLQPLRSSLSGSALVQANGDLVVAGTSYRSPSAAAAALSGNVAEPGWDFWGAPSGDGGFVPLAVLRERFLGGQTARPLVPDSAEESSAPTSERSSAIGRAGGSAVRRRRYWSKTTVNDLIAAGLLHPDETLTPSRPSVTTTGRLMPDGRIEVAGRAYGSLSRAAVVAAQSKAEPGWRFWTVERDGCQVSLFSLRADYESSRPS